MPTSVTSTRLEMKFGTLSGIKTWSFPNIQPDITEEPISNLARTMIEHGGIYRYPPLTLDSVNLIETTTTPIDIELN